jgi:hypothetical protein
VRQNLDLAQSLKVFIEHFIKADRVRDRVRVLQERGSLGDFDNAKVLNQEICRYWELVLGDQRTNLTDDDLDKVRAAEASVRAWLDQGGR